MKPNQPLYALVALFLVMLLGSCRPSALNFRTGPHFGPSSWVGPGHWAGPGAFGPRQFWGPRPWVGMHRPPVILHRRFQQLPRYGYYNRPFNGPSNGGYRSPQNQEYRTYGPQQGGSRGPR